MNGRTTRPGERPCCREERRRARVRAATPGLSQPVCRLRGFERVTLAPGQTATVSRTLSGGDIGVYDNLGSFRVENGTIEVYAGDRSSQSDNTATFRVVGGDDPRSRDDTD